MSHPVTDHSSPAAQPVVPVGPRPTPPTFRAAPQPAAKSGLDWVAVLEGLRRRWLLALCLGVIAAGAVGAAVWFFLPPLEPEVEVLLLVQSTTPTVLPTNDRGERVASQQTHMTLMKSQPVLVAALRQDTKNEALPDKVGDLDVVKSKGDLLAILAWLEKELEVKFVSDEILAIRLRGPNPEELKEVVNAVADTYLRDVVDEERRARSERLEHLREIEKQYTEKVKATRDSVRALKKGLGGNDPVTIAYKQQLLQAEVGMLTTELLEVGRQIRRIEFSLKQANGKDADPGEDAALAAEEARDQLMQAYRIRQQELEMIIRDRRAKARRPEEAVAPHLKEQAEIKELIQNRRDELRQQLAKKGGPPVSREEQKNQLEELEKDLENRIETLNKKAETQVVRELDLEDFTRDIERTESLLQAVSEKADTLQIELERAPDRVKLVNPKEGAVVRQPDNESRQVRMTALGAAGAFGAVVFLVGFWEFRTRRVNSPVQLVNGVGLDLVGTVPNYSRRLADKYTPSGWQRQLMESVDSARTLLLYKARKENLKVVMIASAVGGEGKTSLACHLATSLARAGRATLLIDADLRKPTAHAVFQMELDPGLCDVLRGTATLEQAVRATNIPNLAFLGAGRCDEHALAALAADGLGPVMQHLRERYDFVVVDSSPILPVADALIIGEQVDGVLFSVLQNVSRLPKVQAACQRLASVGIRLLGAVVSGTDDRGHGYGGYGYDYYYYGRGRRDAQDADGTGPGAAEDEAPPQDPGQGEG